jgi:hypothetical protein
MKVAVTRKLIFDLIVSRAFELGTILQKRRVSIARLGGDPPADAVLGLHGDVSVAL